MTREQYYPSCDDVNACVAADDVLQARDPVNTFAAEDEKGNLNGPQQAAYERAKANLTEARAVAAQYGSPPSALERCIGCILNKG